MERATGIGGVFLRAQDPKALQGWYEQHLGLQPEADGCVVFRWNERATRANASTVWAPFDADTDYFGSRDQQAMETSGERSRRHARPAPRRRGHCR